MFDANALELLIKTAQGAGGIRSLPDDRDGKARLFDVRGELVERPVPPPLRDHQVCDLVSLIALAIRPTNPSPVIWYCATDVRLILDDDDRREIVVFQLTPSAEFAKLCELEETSSPLTQMGLIRLLRLELNVPSEQLAPFRRLDWSQRTGGGAKIEHTKQSLGRQIEAEISGADALPDSIGILIPVYREAGERVRYEVRCAIEINPTDQTFLLRPFPGQLDTAIELHQQDIASRLKENVKSETGLKQSVAVYHGQP